MVAIYLFSMLIMGKYQAAHAFCPFSPICFGLMPFGQAGNLLIFFSSAIIFGLLICISTIFIGRKFCGYICPFGTLQEYLFQLRKKKYRLTKRIPFFYEYKFRRIKYLILTATAILTISGLSYTYMKFCPVMIISGLPKLMIPGIVTLIMIIGMGLLTERFWCRFLCPMAALMNLFQYMGKLFGFRRLMIYRNLETCIDCSLCNKNCTMNIDIQCKEYTTDVNCIHCLKCMASCPKKGTLSEKQVSKDCYE
jgi:polyferredoxin